LGIGQRKGGALQWLLIIEWGEPPVPRPQVGRGAAGRGGNEVVTLVSSKTSRPAEHRNSWMKSRSWGGEGGGEAHPLYNDV